MGQAERTSASGETGDTGKSQKQEGAKAKASDCLKCEGSGVVINPGVDGAHAVVCACSQRCPLCRDSHYLFQKDKLGREIAVMCDCEKRRIRVRLYNEAGVPAKYANAVLSDKTRDKFNKEAFSMFRLMARDYKRGQRGVVLMGAPGVGKTWLVAAFVRELVLQHGVPMLFRDFFHLLSEIRSGYSQDQPESQLINPLVEVEVLVIDELGKGRNTPWELNILDVIISQRYNHNKTTIFTSNYTENKSSTLAERVRAKDTSQDDREIKDTLRERIGSRINSRLKEMCDFVALDGPDRREMEPHA